MDVCPPVRSRVEGNYATLPRNSLGAESSFQMEIKASRSNLWGFQERKIQPLTITDVQPGLLNFPYSLTQRVLDQFLLTFLSPVYQNKG